MASADPGERLSVVAIGGAGAMGRYGVRTAVKLGSAHRLVIADRNIDAARRFAAEVGGPCEAAEVDASDRDSLMRTFEGHDVVLNTTGPFARFATPILRAAIDSGCDYIDIDDDWQSTVEALELDELARQEGRTVIVGLGSSPGVSNLCALVAARRLDRVHEIITGWKLSGAVLEEEPEYPSGPAGAALQHWLLQSSEEIKIWGEDGLESARPVQNFEFDFPGVGSVKAYTIGHPEPITLPRYVPGLERSVNVMTGPDWVFEHLRAVAADYTAGKLTLEAGAGALDNPPRPEGGSRKPTSLPICWSLARGERDGKATSIAVYPRRWPRGKMGGNTGVPLAIGLELLRQGEIAEPGVHAPEGVVEPEAFFDLMAQLIDPPAASGEEMLAIDEQVTA